jgi:hypothetical protein
VEGTDHPRAYWRARVRGHGVGDEVGVGDNKEVTLKSNDGVDIMV